VSSVQAREQVGLADGPGPWSEPDVDLETLPGSPASSDDSWATPRGPFAGPKEDVFPNAQQIFSVFLSDVESSLAVVLPRLQVTASSAVHASPHPTSPPARLGSSTSSTDLALPLVSFREYCRQCKEVLLTRSLPKRPRKKRAPPATMRRSSRVVGRFAPGTLMSH
jgi:hypothetical protein